MTLPKMTILSCIVATSLSTLLASENIIYTQELVINTNGQLVLLIPEQNSTKEPVYNKEYFSKTTKEKEGITIVGNNIDIKHMSIKDAEVLLKKPNMRINPTPKDITIIKNTKGEIVYIAQGISAVEAETIQKRVSSPTYKSIKRTSVKVPHYDQEFDLIGTPK